MAHPTMTSMANIKPKMSKRAAEFLVEGARLDLAMNRLPDDVLAELVKRFGYLPYGKRIQVIVGAKNKKAAEAFWDKKYDVAVYWLRASGLPDDARMKMPAPDATVGILSPRMFGKLGHPQHDWKYVK